MPKKKIDAEMQTFAQDVLTSIQQAKRGEGRVHQVTLSAAAEVSAHLAKLGARSQPALGGRANLDQGGSAVA
jgi:hypothetical protein